MAWGLVFKDDGAVVVECVEGTATGRKRCGVEDAGAEVAVVEGAAKEVLGGDGVEVGEEKEGDEVVEVWGPIVEKSGERVVASDGEGEGVGVTTKAVWVVEGDLVDGEWGWGSGNGDLSRLFEGEGAGVLGIGK